MKSQPCALLRVCASAGSLAVSLLHCLELRFKGPGDYHSQQKDLLPGRGRMVYLQRLSQDIEDRGCNLYLVV